jgi:hypothetical protein
MTTQKMAEFSFEMLVSTCEMIQYHNLENHNLKEFIMNIFEYLKHACYLGCCL